MTEEKEFDLSKYCCEQCGDQTPGVMVHNKVWKAISGCERFLCLTCMEAKLGREITLNDLDSCGMNRLIRIFVLRERYKK